MAKRISKKRAGPARTASERPYLRRKQQLVHIQEEPGITLCGQPGRRKQDVETAEANCPLCLRKLRSIQDVERFTSPSGSLRSLQPQAKVGQGQLGWVHRFDIRQGYGFIRLHNGGDVFVHRSGILNGQPLEAGMLVRVDIIKTAKGLRATNVRTRVADSLRTIVGLPHTPSRLGGSRKPEASDMDAESWRIPGPE